MQNPINIEKKGLQRSLISITTPNNHTTGLQRSPISSTLAVRLLSLLLFLSLLSPSLSAQDEVVPQDGQDEPAIQNEDIEVIRLYEPILAKAKKVSLTPDGFKTNQSAPSFNDYTVPSRFLSLSFDPPTLRPLVLKPKRPKLTEKLWLKAGFGNYTTPYVDLGLSSTQANNNILGLNLKHHSSRVKENYHQDFMTNHGKVFGKFFTDQTYFEAEAAYDHDRFFWYGYDWADTASYPALEDARIVYQTISASLGFGNSIENRARISHKSKIDYHYHWNNWTSNEHNIALNTGIYKDWDNGISFGLDLMADFTGYGDSIQTGVETIELLAFNALPNIAFRQPWGEVRVGANLIVDQNDFIPAPYLRAEAYLLEKRLTLFGGWDKKIKKNNFRSLSEANPWLLPIVGLDNSIKESRYIGVKGNVNGSFMFELSGGQYITKKQALFKNYALDTSRFVVAYDSSLNAVGGQTSLSYQVNSRLDVYLGGSYFKYTTTSEDFAWHMPELTVNLGANFSPLEKLNIGADLNVYDKMKAIRPNGSIVEIDGLVDVNLSADYRIAENLYLFLDLNNITNRKYQRFYAYPSYGFNFLAGIVLRY